MTNPTVLIAHPGRFIEAMDAATRRASAAPSTRPPARQTVELLDIEPPAPPVRETIWIPAVLPRRAEGA